MNRSSGMITGNQKALQSRRFSNANIIEMRKQGKHVNAHPKRNVRREMARNYVSPQGSATFMIYRV